MKSSTLGFCFSVGFWFLNATSGHAYEKFLEVTRFGFRPKLGLSPGLKKVDDLSTVAIGSVMRVHPLELLPSQESIGKAQVLQIVNSVFAIPAMARIVEDSLDNPDFRAFLSSSREGKEFLYSFFMNFDPTGLRDEDLKRIIELRGLLRSSSILTNVKGELPKGIARKKTLKKEILPQDRSIAHLDLGAAINQQLEEVLSGGEVLEKALSQMAHFLEESDSERPRGGMDTGEPYHFVLEEFRRRIQADPKWYGTLGLAELSFTTLVKAWNNRTRENQQTFADHLFSKYVEAYEKKDASPGVIDPEQKIFISDGHHGLRTAYELMEKIKRYDVFRAYKPSDFFVRISIDYNFSVPGVGSKYYEYLIQLCEDRKLYFSPETRARLTHKILGLLSGRAGPIDADRFEELQRKVGRQFFKGVRSRFGGDVSRVEDDRMRSFVGSAIPSKIDSRKHRLNIDNKFLVDYFEFYMAEWLSSKGFTLLSQESILLNSPRGAGEANYLDKQRNYIGHLVAVNQAKQLVYGSGPLSLDFEKFLLRMFDQNKFSRARQASKDVAHPLAIYLQERENYQKRETESIETLASDKGLQDLTVLELLAPIKISTPEDRLHEGPLLAEASQNTYRMSSHSILNSHDLLIQGHPLFKAGSCLNPLGQSVPEVISASRANLMPEKMVSPENRLTSHMAALSRVIQLMQDPLQNLRIIHYLENNILPPVIEDAAGVVESIPQYVDL